MCDDPRLDNEVKEIEDCRQLVEYNYDIQTYSGGTVTTSKGTKYGCRMCDKYYWGKGTFDSITGSSECYYKHGEEPPIKNCEYFYSDSKLQCDACARGYVVTNDGAKCVQYEFDSNCRKLAPDNKNCLYCWHGFQWEDGSCYLKSFLLRKWNGLGAIGLTLLFIWLE